MSRSTANASISGSSVVPGLPNNTSTPSCFRISRNARFPEMTGKGSSMYAVFGHDLSGTGDAYLRSRYLCSPVSTSSLFWLWMVAAITTMPVVRCGISAVMVCAG